MSEREKLETLVERALDDLEASEIEAIKRELIDEPDSLAEFEALLEMKELSVARIEPPASLDGPILAAAQAAARVKGAGEPLTGRRTALERTQRWLSRALRGPQVAMATISLLVVAISLFFVPLREEEAREGGESALTQATRELPREREARDPLEPPSGQGFMEEESEKATPAPSATAGSAGVARQRRAPERAALDRPAPERAASRRAELDSSEAATADGAEGPSAASSRALQRAASPEGSAALQEQSAPQPSRMEAPSAAAPQKMNAEREIAQPSERADMSDTEARSDEDSAKALGGIEEFRALFAGANYARASELGQALLRDKRGRSNEIAEILSLTARAERRAGRCARAMPLYERLLREYPERAAADQILREMELCAQSER